MIVTETNRYAATIVGNTAHARPWYDVTVEEMKAFFGIVIMYYDGDSEAPTIRALLVNQASTY